MRSTGDQDVEQTSAEGGSATAGSVTAGSGTAVSGTTTAAAAAVASSPPAPTCTPPVAPWHPGWTVRHALVAAAAAVAAWLFYGDLAVGVGGPGRVAILGLLSLAAGLVVASYLPRAGERFSAPRDLCAYSPVLMLLAAGFFLTIADGSLWGASPALLLAAAAVLRRTPGSSTCSV